MAKLLWTAALFAALTACGSAPSAPATPMELTRSEFLIRVANYETSPSEFRYLGDKPAVVDFYAPWCGPCRSMAPILDELAAEYRDQIVVYKVNTDNEPELAAVFGVRSLPTLLFIPLGNVGPSMSEGALSREQLKEAMEALLH